MQLNSLDDVINDITRENTHGILLLGNGFSRECCVANKITDVFCYSKLLDKIRVKDSLTPKRLIINLFDCLDTDDFEYAVRVLNAVKVNQSIVEIFDTKKISTDMASLYEEIKKSLAESILSIHPSHQYDNIKPDSYKRCGDFIKRFQYVFTTNYDLLLYWTQMNNPNLKKSMVDGFWGIIERKNYWDLNMEPNLLPGYRTISYLHGGLHLFTDSELSRVPYKIVNQRSGDMTSDKIIEKIKGEIVNGRMPLCVTEGNSGHKYDRISRNNYLTYCFELLKKVNGSPVTYGISFSNDEHVLNATKSNKKIKTIYVGTHNNNDEAFERAKRILEKSKIVHRYNTDQTHPWGT